jgi:hypothetical protein
MSMMTQSQDSQRKSPRQIWQLTKNEATAGQNPYAGGFKEVSQSAMERK